MNKGINIRTPKQRFEDYLSKQKKTTKNRHFDSVSFIIGFLVGFLFAGYLSIIIIK